MTTGTDAARAATRRDDLRRRLRGTSGRARKLRGLIVLLAPYRTRVVLMFAALVAGTAASLAPAPLAKTAIDSSVAPMRASNSSIRFFFSSSVVAIPFFPSANAFIRSIYWA